MKDNLEIYWNNVAADLIKIRTLRYFRAKKIFVFLLLLFIAMFFIYKKHLKNFNRPCILFSIFKDSNMPKKIDKNLPEWNFSYFFYESIEDPKIEEDIKNINKKIEKFLGFNKEIGKKINTVNPSTLHKKINQYEEISKDIYKLSLYSYLLIAKDSQNKEYNAFYNKINNTTLNWSTQLNEFSLAFSKITSKRLETLLGNKDLKQDYAHFLKDEIKIKPYLFIDKIESFVSENSNALNSSIVKFYDKKLSSLSIDMAGKKHTLAEATNIMNNDSSKSKRKAAYEAINRALLDVSEDIVFVMNALAGSHNTAIKYRGYEQSISSRNLSNNISDKAVKEMVDVVKSYYPKTAHRYYKLKAKLLKTDKIDYYDRNVKVNNSTDSIKFDFKDSKEFIVDIFNSVSPVLGASVLEAFDKNLIDAPSKIGKASGAFCTHVFPMVLMNWHADQSSLTTLGHELGHWAQMRYTTSKKPFLVSSGSPLILAEIPSTFIESIIYEKLMKNADSREKKIFYLTSIIEDHINAIIRQISFLDFELAIHEERKNGELSFEKINKLWNQSIYSALGEYVAQDDKNNIWVAVSHFFHSTYYVYAYSFSKMITSLLLMQHKQDAVNFEKTYMNFLENINSEMPNDLLKNNFAIDINNQKAWQDAMNYLVSLIDELESLI
jgi:oligoendopeptidase F